MRDRRSPVEGRLALVFKVETSEGREEFHPSLSRRRSESGAPPAGISRIREAIELCVSDLVEDGLLPPWSL